MRRCTSLRAPRRWSSASPPAAGERTACTACADAALYVATCAGTLAERIAASPGERTAWHGMRGAALYVTTCAETLAERIAASTWGAHCLHGMR